MTTRLHHARDLAIAYDFADYTDAWRRDERETFLLYPGYCRTMAFWRAWVPLLGRDYRVLRVDPRGYGASSKPLPGAPISAADLVNDAIGVMDALDLRSVHWVGEATGGTLGLQAAADHPERIASVTLCNGFAKQPGETAGVYALGEKDQAAAIEKHGVAEWSRRTLHHRMDLQRAPGGLAEWVTAEMARTPAYVAADMFRFFSRVDLRPRLGEVKAPVLLLVGALCAERLKRAQQEMRDYLARATFVEIEGYDYGFSLLAPERAVAAIRTFLNSVNCAALRPTAT
jgi:pimeloyl-ACP methyl ester carboxylesterase